MPSTLGRTLPGDRRFAAVRNGKVTRCELLLVGTAADDGVAASVTAAVGAVAVAVRCVLGARDARVGGGARCVDEWMIRDARAEVVGGAGELECRDALDRGGAGGRDAAQIEV